MVFIAAWYHEGICMSRNTFYFLHIFQDMGRVCLDKNQYLWGFALTICIVWLLGRAVSGGASDGYVKYQTTKLASTPARTNEPEAKQKISNNFG
jgi:hypothetical protein